MNWRGRPLTSVDVIISLIASTKTNTGLCVECAFDNGEYPNVIKVEDEELEAVHIVKDDFHGEWNYTISP